MEETKALHRLAEAADLIGMIEDIFGAGASERLSTTAWSGIRITLRNAREMISSSHSSLATEFIGRTKMAYGPSQSSSSSSTASITNGNGESAKPLIERHVRHELGTNGAANQSNGMSGSDMARTQPLMTRRDLKASLEKMIEKP